MASLSCGCHLSGWAGSAAGEDGDYRAWRGRISTVISTLPPPSRCTRPRVRCSWPRSTTGGPIRPGLYGARGGPGCCSTTLGRSSLAGRCPPRRGVVHHVGYPGGSSRRAGYHARPPAGRRPVGGVRRRALERAFAAGSHHAASVARSPTFPVDHDAWSIDAARTLCGPLDDDTALACLQAANHEVGTVQPVAAVAPPAPAWCTAAGRRGPGRRSTSGSGGVDVAGSECAQVGRSGGGRCSRDPARDPLAACRPPDERGSGRVPGSRTSRLLSQRRRALRARSEEAATLAVTHPT